MEDEQKLYDSLDEEENCQKVTLNSALLPEEKTTPRKNELRTKNYADGEKCDVRGNPEKCDVSQVIPLYNGETIKTDIRLPKTKSSNTKKGSRSEIDSDSSRNNIIGNRMRQNSKVDLLSRSVTFQKEKKSYLSLFHARIGYPTDETLRDTPDTTRAMCGDTSRTVSSTTTSTELFEDAQTEIINEENKSDDSESFYLQHIKNETKDSKTSDTATLKYLKSTSFCSFSSSENSPLRSVSQQLLENNCRTTPKKKSSKKCPAPIPTLGYLGPDVEKNKTKLELLRKKQQYGQNVSDKNRIKFMEAKALSELKNQLKSGLTSRSSE